MFFEALRSSVDAFLRRRDPDVTPLSEQVLNEQYPLRSIGVAWRVRLAPGDKRLVDLLLPPNAPFDPPMVGIAPLAKADRPKYGTIRGGTMCIELENEAWPIVPDATVANLALQRAAAAIDQWKERPPEEVRALEIASYWRWSGAVGQMLYSLLDVSPGSRPFFAASKGSRTYIADEIDLLDDLLDRLDDLKDVRRRVGLFIDSGTLPRHIVDADSLLEWIRASGTGGDVFVKFLNELEEAVPIVLRAAVGDDVALLGAWLHRDEKSDFQFERATVQRIDPQWLFTRGPGTAPPPVLEKRVVVVGVGSLGSAVAEGLARGGVGHMVLIDDDVLAFDNILRHRLGASDVGYGKALGMWFHLRRALPFVDVAYYGERWQTVWEETPEVLTNADLVISTAADWPSEAFLNFTARTVQDFPPVLYAWLEDRAAAAQMLFVSQSGGCLSCGMSPDGMFIGRAVEFDRPTSVRIPGCAGFFQPYAAADADAAASVVVEGAIDVLSSVTRNSALTTWIGSTESLARQGGRLRQQWLDRHGDVGEGRVKRIGPWPINAECPLCA